MITLPHIPAQWFEQMAIDLDLDDTLTLNQLTDPGQDSLMNDFILKVSKTYPLLQNITKDDLLLSIIYMRLQHKNMNELIAHGISIENFDKVNIFPILKAISNSFISPAELDDYFSFEENQSKFIHLCLYLLTEAPSLNENKYSEMILRSIFSAMIYFNDSNEDISNFICNFELIKVFNMGLNDLIVLCNLVAEKGFETTMSQLDNAIQLISHNVLTIDKIKILLNDKDSNYQPDYLIQIAVAYLGMQSNAAKNKKENLTSTGIEKIQHEVSATKVAFHNNSMFSPSKTKTVRFDEDVVFIEKNLK